MFVVTIRCRCCAACDVSGVFRAGSFFLIGRSKCFLVAAAALLFLVGFGRYKLILPVAYCTLLVVVWIYRRSRHCVVDETKLLGFTLQNLSS